MERKPIELKSDTDTSTIRDGDFSNISQQLTEQRDVTISKDIEKINTTSNMKRHPGEEQAFGKCLKMEIGHPDQSALHPQNESSLSPSVSADLVCAGLEEVRELHGQRSSELIQSSLLSCILTALMLLSTPGVCVLDTGSA